MAELLVVFDAPDYLKHEFLENGFLPFGRQRGAWFRRFEERGDETRDLEYELTGVGLRPRWWVARE
jgi:hypothetical protein